MVLVDRNDLRVHQDRLGLVRHRPQVVARNQGGREHGPETHVRAVFIGVHAAVADLQHVGVVPVARTGVRRNSDLAEADLVHGIPGVADVARRPPQVAADLGSPRPDIRQAVLAQAVDDGPARMGKRIPHHLVDALLVRLRDLVDGAVAAEVILQVVDSPCGKLLGILLFMAEAGRVSRAGKRSGRRVDTDLQTLRMNVVGKALHVGELLVGQDVALRVTPTFPGVVDVDIGVAHLVHPACDHRVGHRAHVIRRDASGKLVPAVPSHRRGADEPVIRQVVKRRKWDRLRRSGSRLRRPHSHALDDLALVAMPLHVQLPVADGSVVDHGGGSRAGADGGTGYRRRGFGGEVQFAARVGTAQCRSARNPSIHLSSNVLSADG